MSELDEGVPVFKHHNKKSGGKAARNLNAGRLWRWDITYTLRLLYLHGKTHSRELEVCQDAVVKR
jgi:hypothetical protein